MDFCFESRAELEILQMLLGIAAAELIVNQTFPTYFLSSIRFLVNSH